MSLCFGYLESRKFPDFLFKTLQHKVSIGMCLIHTAWAIVLLVRIKRAMREPQVAEQQQCSPAFFMYWDIRNSINFKDKCL